jgi:cytochrome c biogenesis protein CcdA
LEGAAEDLAEKRYGGFTLGAVLAAGLIDGINPCAISTLIFFMSLLAVSTPLRHPSSPRLCRSSGSGGHEVQKSRLLILGVSYCLASFLTYLALGFGLLRVLHLFSGFTLLRSAVEWGMTAVLLGLAFLSFRDAWRFGRSRDAHDIQLQLSTGMKKRIHRVMRRGLKPGHLIFGGLFIGASVTALESVCTGQVYVPTLVLILKDSAFSASRAWLYLLAYNLMFMVPLVLIFIAVYRGIQTETLLRWSQKNVVLSKTLLGLFFVLMALFILNI